MRYGENNISWRPSWIWPKMAAILKFQLASIKNREQLILIWVSVWHNFVDLLHTRSNWSDSLPVWSKKIHISLVGENLFASERIRLSSMCIHICNGTNVLKCIGTKLLMNWLPFSPGWDPGSATASEEPNLRLQISQTRSWPENDRTMYELTSVRDGVCTSCLENNFVPLQQLLRSDALEHANIEPFQTNEGNYISGKVLKRKDIIICGNLLGVQYINISNLA